MDSLKIFWQENQYNQNTHVIETDNGAILIDAGADYYEIVNTIQRPILALFITHSHFDHIVALDSYIQAGVKIYLTKLQHDCMKDDVFNVSKIFGESRQFEVRDYQEIHGGDEIWIDNVCVNCIDTPGHSADSMSFLVGDNLFSGDTAFAMTIGRTDFINSSNQAMINSLTKLNNINFNLMYSGHGRASNKQEQIYNMNHYIKFLSQEIANGETWNNDLL